MTGQNVSVKSDNTSPETNIPVTVSSNGLSVTKDAVVTVCETVSGAALQNANTYTV